MYDEELNETYEIALVCFPENEPEIVKVSFTVKAIFIFISVFFLLLTLYIYYRLPELRQTQVKMKYFYNVNCDEFTRYSNFLFEYIGQSNDVYHKLLNNIFNIFGINANLLSAYIKIRHLFVSSISNLFLYNGIFCMAELRYRKCMEIRCVS
jgi:hypothetical protein